MFKFFLIFFFIYVLYKLFLDSFFYTSIISAKYTDFYNFVEDTDLTEKSFSGYRFPNIYKPIF